MGTACADMFNRCTLVEHIKAGVVLAVAPAGTYFGTLDHGLVKYGSVEFITNQELSTRLKRGNKR